MVSIGLSEFTFGFAFLYEQTRRNWQNLTAVPILPSLRQEAEDAWDAHLPLVGTDFYYQFKLSDLLSHGNARYIKDGTYDAPYYRIALHRRDNNRQHRKLKQHAAINPNTYYVAPEISNIDDFNSAFLANQIVSRSRLIPVIHCQDFDDGEQHFITFEEGVPQWRDHSEEVLHEKSFFGKKIESLYRSTSGNWSKIDRDFAADLFTKLESSIHDLPRKDGKIAKSLRVATEDELAHQEKGDILKKAAQLAAVFFGLTLVIVGRPRS
jgi:hypothetical protein